MQALVIPITVLSGLYSSIDNHKVLLYVNKLVVFERSVMRIAIMVITSDMIVYVLMNNIIYIGMQVRRLLYIYRKMWL